jgi:hypothetical protein
MGSLANLEIGEALTVRTYKVVPGQPLAWANTYEILSNQPASQLDQVVLILERLRDIIVSFERSILNAAYVLDRIVVSTYVPDGTPYDPYTFVSFPIGLAGQYFTPGNPLLPLQFCALVKRIVNFGRQGNILFRGIVAANDAEITPSGTVIKPNRVDSIQSALNTFMSELATYGFSLAMVRGRQAVETSTLRLVSALNAKRDMTFKQLNNRYFDKVRQ